MKELDLSLSNLESVLPDDFTQEQRAKAKTLFLKKLSLSAHAFYGGKMQTFPKCGLYGFNWFNVWYTPGVSKVSTTIRDLPDRSFELSNRGNLVAVVSDSTRVLGDGDCGPAGGLGVMEGKAFLMKYLGGVDAVALCIDARGRGGKTDPEKIIDFVRMAQPSFGAVNLEDISQPNCFRVLDELRESCEIPVWHDDAQGTACVTLAGLLNALELAGKKLSDAKIVLFGAGASNTTIARLILSDGGDPGKLIMFDTKGSLHSGRKDIYEDSRFYRKRELCETTNPGKIETMEEAMRGADVLIALATPGPDTVKRSWVRLMAPKSIVFACANPVPEIWPFAAKEEGAFIVATGRGDFPNQVNNSICFPGILKGALLIRAKKITDGMAIRCARSLADFAKRKGINPERIVPTMEDADVFAREAADVADQAKKEGVARIELPWETVYEKAKNDIAAARKTMGLLMESGAIAKPDHMILQKALAEAIEEAKSG